MDLEVHPLTPSQNHTAPWPAFLCGWLDLRNATIARKIPHVVGFSPHSEEPTALSIMLLLPPMMTQMSPERKWHSSQTVWQVTLADWLHWVETDANIDRKWLEHLIFRCSPVSSGQPRHRALSHLSERAWMRACGRTYMPYVRIRACVENAGRSLFTKDLAFSLTLIHPVSTLLQLLAQQHWQATLPANTGD